MELALDGDELLEVEGALLLLVFVDQSREVLDALALSLALGLGRLHAFAQSNAVAAQLADLLLTHHVSFAQVGAHRLDEARVVRLALHARGQALLDGERVRLALGQLGRLAGDQIAQLAVLHLEQVAQLEQRLDLLVVVVEHLVELDGLAQLLADRLVARLQRRVCRLHARTLALGRGETRHQLVRLVRVATLEVAHEHARGAGGHQLVALARFVDTRSFVFVFIFIVVVLCVLVVSDLQPGRGGCGRRSLLQKVVDTRTRLLLFVVLLLGLFGLLRCNCCC